MRLARSKEIVVGGERKLEIELEEKKMLRLCARPRISHNPGGPTCVARGKKAAAVERGEAGHRAEPTD